MGMNSYFQLEDIMYIQEVLFNFQSIRTITKWTRLLGQIVHIYASYTEHLSD